MKLSDYDYELPAGAIAETPVERRDAARLLVHDIAREATRHRRVRDLPDLLEPGDCLVVNDTRVLPARLACQRETGGRVEVLLIEPETAGALDGRWHAWVSPSRKLRSGEALTVVGHTAGVRLVERPLAADGDVAMHWVVEFDLGAEDLEAFLTRAGSMPLPPYIERAANALDHERYQTVYARVPGAVAAPTAGLHLTDELFGRLAERGVERASVTLHVGPGTFRPIQVEDLRQHEMHAERYELPAATVDAIARARARGGRVVAVGTTSARVLESCPDGAGGVVAGRGSTRLFLHPENPPKVIDALLTNFHLPRSSLLVLVASIAGRERILSLYVEALREGYRFFSYGDAMLLLR